MVAVSSEEQDTTTTEDYNCKGQLYSLTFAQQPVHARSSGCGSRADTRRPVDPPPIVSLCVCEDGDVVTLRCVNNFILKATLIPISIEDQLSSNDGAQNNTDELSNESRKGRTITESDDYNIRSSHRPSRRSKSRSLENLIGTTTASLSFLKSGSAAAARAAAAAAATASHVSQDASSRPIEEGNNGESSLSYFLFPDLSIRHEGVYRLRFSLYEVFPDCTVYRNSINSDPIIVYPPKKFPGLVTSTALTREIAAVGTKVRVRQDATLRKKRRKSFREDDHDSHLVDDYRQSPQARPSPLVSPGSSHNILIPNSNSSQRFSSSPQLSQQFTSSAEANYSAQNSDQSKQMMTILPPIPFRGEADYYTSPHSLPPFAPPNANIASNQELRTATNENPPRYFTAPTNKNVQIAPEGKPLQMGTLRPNLDSSGRMAEHGYPIAVGHHSVGPAVYTNDPSHYPQYVDGSIVQQQQQQQQQQQYSNLQMFPQRLQPSNYIPATRLHRLPGVNLYYEEPKQQQSSGTPGHSPRQRLSEDRGNDEQSGADIRPSSSAVPMYHPMQDPRNMPQRAAGYHPVTEIDHMPSAYGYLQQPYQPIYGMPDQLSGHTGYYYRQDPARGVPPNVPQSLPQRTTGPAYAWQAVHPQHGRPGMLAYSVPSVRPAGPISGPPSGLVYRQQKGFHDEAFED